MPTQPVFWRRLPIVGLCEAHVDCVNRTAPVVSEPTPFKMLRTTNVRNGYVDTENCRFVTEETYKKWTRRLVPKRGDIILTREAPLGDVGKIRTDDTVFLGQRLYHFRPDPNKLDADFLLYSLLGDDLQSQIRGYGSGSTVEHMRLEDIPCLEFNVPHLPVQKRIAGILSAYDELIENSQRRIKILEAMARGLYREWFVHFRFPGHENHPRVASALGEIPEGWEVQKLGQVATVLRGRSYRSVDLAVEGGLPFLNLKCLDRDGGFRRSGLKRYVGEYKDSHIARKGDIVMAVTDMTQERRIVARAALVPTLASDFSIFSMDLVRIEPKADMPKTFLYSFLRFSSFADEVKQHANGANVLHLSPDRISEYQFAVPPIGVVSKFAEFASPVIEQMNALENRIGNLRCTRDLLLPRLLSGQISVDTEEVIK
jgi:type I restriction enzyme S subunit